MLGGTCTSCGRYPCQSWMEEDDRSYWAGLIPNDGCQSYCKKSKEKSKGGGW